MTRCALASAFLLSALSLALLGLTESAAAKPTEAQLSAIKSNCRSDFMSNCWGVTRGGAEAFQCLKEHMASLSPGCAQAVKAVSPPAPAPAAPKKAEPAPAPPPAAEPAPVAAEAEPAAPPAKETPPPATEAKATAPAAVPEAAPAPAPKAASETPKAEAKAPPPPQASEPPPAAPKAAAAEPDAAPPIIGFIPPRKKLMVLRNCRRDLETYCAGVDYGDGRQLHCLFSNKASLTSDCQGALAKLTN